MSDYPIISSDLYKGDVLDDILDVSVPAPTDGQVLTYDDSTSPSQWIAEDGGGGGGTIEVPPAIIDPSITLDATSIGRPVYFDGALWQLAQADDITTVHVGVIAEIKAFNVIIMLLGECINIHSSVNGGSNLTSGHYYYLSDVSAGQVTDIRPSSDEIVAPIWQALSINSALMLPYRAGNKPPILSGLERKSDVITATAATTYTLVNAICIDGNLNVYLNGTKLILNVDFTHNSVSNEFTLVSAPVAGDTIEAETWELA